ncbi:phytanoyl-CoA dioxygenase family protein [Pacificispira spongiicola]|nr:phytanoyl-CoA dioxygenase family protein [Pacificispira spongiicola]
MTILSQTTIDNFRADGAVLLKGAFADWVDVLEAGLDRNLKDPAPNARFYRGEGDEAEKNAEKGSNKGGGAFFADYCNWARIPEYRSFVFESPAAQIAAELTGSDSIRMFHEHVVLKESATPIPTPWHHDLPYYCLDGSKTCSLWVALDHVPKERAVEYLAGSHRWGKLYEPQYFSGKSVNEDTPWETLPDIDAHREDYEILSWATEPGDAIAFSFQTVHGAPANNSMDRRAAIAFRWMGDDVTYLHRNGKTSPPFPNLTLKDGDPMDAPEFPLVWPGTAA